MAMSKMKGKNQKREEKWNKRKTNCKRAMDITSEGERERERERGSERASEAMSKKNQKETD
jgi:hypothetical protein